MEFMRRAWSQIQLYFERVTPTTKLLIGSLVVIVLLSFFVVMQYAGKAELTALPQLPPDRQAEAVSRLQSAGIKTVVQGGQIMVQPDKATDAMALLMQSELMTANSAAAFDQWMKGQNPWLTNDQNAKMFMLAKQKVLGQIIAKMNGVRSADVMLSPAERQSFGSPTARPSASVNLVMTGGRKVDKRLVEAVAGLISGSVSGMKPQDVVVIDANVGRQFTVKDSADSAPGETEELFHAKEVYAREKIAEALGYIPGVIIAVNIKSDATITRHTDETVYEKSQPIKSEFTREHDRREASGGGGEAGVRPNTGASIDLAGASGGSDKTTESRTEYGDAPVTKRTKSVEAGHTTRKVSVTVNVPRGYFASLYKQGKPGDSADPKDDDAEFKKLQSEQIAQIEAQVKPLISAESEGVVKVSMIPDLGVYFAGPGGTVVAGGVARAGSVDGFMSMVEPGMIKTAGLGVLALVSVALMFSMVRKATQAPPMPTVHELAGVPATLPVDDDLVGDAEAAEADMAGVELAEGDIHTRKIAEQIGELVKTNPAEAAQLFNRWIRKES